MVGQSDAPRPAAVPSSPPGATSHTRCVSRSSDRTSSHSHSNSSDYRGGDSSDSGLPRRVTAWLSKLSMTTPDTVSSTPTSPTSSVETSGAEGLHRRRSSRGVRRLSSGSEPHSRVSSLARAASERVRRARSAWTPESSVGVWLCGTYYGPDPDAPGSAWRQALAEQIGSLVWCSYRRDFPPIARDGVICADEEGAAAAVSAVAEDLCARSHTAPSLGQLLTNPTDVLPTTTEIRSWLLQLLEQRGWQLPALVYQLPVAGASNSAQAQAAVAQSLVAVLDAVEREVVRPLRRPLAARLAQLNSPVLERVSEVAGLPTLWCMLEGLHAKATSLTRSVGPSTDAGWGCMIRTAQCVLANALIRVRLGGAWRRGNSTAEQHAEYVRILSCFFDNPSAACPFSIHRFAAAGRRLGTEVGSWLGPGTAALAMKELVDGGDHGLGVVVTNDGMLCAADVRHESRDWARPVLVLVVQRLGLEKVHTDYLAALLASFRCAQSVGVAGGRPSTSLYFVGTGKDQLLYLDPHFVRAAVPFRHPPPSLCEQRPAGGRDAPSDTAVPTPDAPGGADARTHGPPAHDSPPLITSWYANAYAPHELASFHAEHIHQMPASGIDPSMLLAFVCTSDDDLYMLRDHIAAQRTPLFCVSETRQPARATPDDLVAVDSDSE